MEIKISKKPVKYEEAIEYLHKRVHQVSQNKNFAGLILETPFTSMIEASKNFYPYIPVGLILKKIEKKWVNSDFSFSRQELLDELNICPKLISVSK